MKTIRKGNDIVVRWRIFRYGQKYDIALYRESISLVLSNMGEKKEITDYTIVDVNTIVFKYRAEDQGLGIYRLLLIDKSRNSTRIIEECNAFRLVNASDAANNNDTLESAITITLTSELTAPADGLSAYEVALQNGFIGTEEEWLQSLKGEQGPQGIQGDKGDKGDRGEQGEKGLSAYQVAIANGFVGTEAEWLQSLVPDTTDIELAEAQRQAKELERIEAENARQSAELGRQNASTEAVASANEAASNANEAAITAQQKAGEANTAASSANAVVDEFKSIIVQETGAAQDKVMSQKAVTDAMTASQAKLSELEGKVNGKQDALTLTVKDNGNIVLANIQGQSKEFMPATPSGDPMHYAYVAAGAEWNGTGSDIVKTAPWASLVDDDADKTVVHKAGYWYLNGLGDITNEQMRTIYNRTNSFASSNILNEVLFDDTLVRTNINQYKRKGSYSTVELAAAFLGSSLEVVLLSNYTNYGISAKSISYMAQSNKIKYFIGVLNTFYCVQFAEPFLKCSRLKAISISKLNFDISFANSSLLTSKSILYMIKNEAAKSSITITLHADAYARAMANADILAALEAHPNVSLASAQ